ncbi:MAG: T9SS type A sorting domain-containing protein [Calditrichaeota bacterium]|nr:T9SS type A sorting domain-containing protein [Calditrichota bacterium]
MADIDDDGDLDLIYGEDEGHIRLYTRDDEGELSFTGNMEADDEVIDLNDRTAPELTDWDLDGDLDMVVGNSDGVITLFINEGSAEEYDFSNQGTIDEDGQEIWLGTETATSFGDFDGDGKRDLVIGSMFGELWFFTNTGENDNPEFGQGVKLQDEDGEISLGYAGYTRPELVDWDRDGDLDIVLGMVEPQLLLYINPADNGVQDGQFETPKSFRITASYPEPFNGTTMLQFETNRFSHTHLSILDLSGRVHRSINLGMLNPGQQQIALDMSEMSCGKYIINLKAADYSISKTVTLIK